MCQYVWAWKLYRHLFRNVLYEKKTVTVPTKNHQPFCNHRNNYSTAAAPAPWSSQFNPTNHQAKSNRRTLASHRHTYPTHPLNHWPAVGWSRWCPRVCPSWPPRHRRRPSNGASLHLSCLIDKFNKVDLFQSFSSKLKIWKQLSLFVLHKRTVNIFLNFSKFLPVFVFV